MKNISHTPRQDFESWYHQDIRSLASSLFRPRRFALPRAAGFFLCRLRRHVRAPLEVPRARCRLELDCFHATLDGARPADGLTLSGGPGGRGIYAKLLGLVLPGHGGGDIESPQWNAYGAFMVISYQEATGRPFRVDAVWRARRRAGGGVSRRRQLDRLRAYGIARQPAGGRRPESTAGRGNVRRRRARPAQRRTPAPAAIGAPCD